MSDHKPMMSEAAARKRLAWQDGVHARGQARPARQSFNFWGRSIVVPRAVFAPVPPRYNLLARAVLREARATDAVLDMGTGSGIQGVMAASRGATVTAIDVNPHAVRCARANAKRNGLAARFTAIAGKLFGPVAGRFDLIIFDPPFRWSPPRDLLEVASADHNYVTLKGFFANAHRHLHEDGRILLHFGTSGDLPFLKHLIKTHGYASKTVLKESNSGWTYFVFRLTKKR